MPVATPPSWQELQAPVILAWEKFAGNQALVLWQSTQSDVVRKCPPGLPVACTPLWQVAQLPVMLS
ncbi:MAG TPA: hypothetical protein ENI97_12990 [Gammaproteobacteria bacterium]|nr:hypothetical protein [Gammaproteobacteria bacterium]